MQIFLDYRNHFFRGTGVAPAAALVARVKGKGVYSYSDFGLWVELLPNLTI